MKVAGFAAWVLFLLIVFSDPSVDGVGVNWGTISTHPLPPKVSVQLLQDNGIKKVKLFDADPSVISALAGSGIEVMIAVPNGDLPAMGDYDKAKEWVNENVVKYNVKDKDGVKITCVGVGNEPFLRFYKNQFTNTTFPALKNIYKALGDAGLADTVKATIPLNADVYESPLQNPVPSAGQFRWDVADLMGQISAFLNQTGNPFMVNIYPFLSYYTSPNFPLDYAFFDGFDKPIADNGGSYSNVFDANFDTLVAALRKAGCGDNIPIIIGEIGWPTEGDVNANITLAGRFYDGLMKKLAAKKGTPLRPNYDIEVYLFGLYDEDAKSTLPGDFERHWGMFTSDGQPKFPMDLAGTGEKKLPVAAKGVQYLANKWCVFNADANDTSKLQDTMKYACDRADCTWLSAGSSCGSLDEQGKASFAFNLYYQNQNQSDQACNFDGMAKVTTTDPSQGSCKFTVQFDSQPSAAQTSSEPGSPPHSAASSLLVPVTMSVLLVMFSLLVLGVYV